MQAATPELPAEFEIWTAMSPMERFAVMERVPYQKRQSVPARFRACLALIKSDMTAALPAKQEAL